ncbi:hypothetical protein K3M67_06500 [Sphingobium sp. V4]|uniref:hypothetical protein n=1 Tax=Sphingobium sp. V4 TaxID=3038927 RepID=UPI0025582478|nr:hypothetical protein [Sphingobium sp. V4]WIW89604.1 hypothetical protein K3M67_06500 [Sphingobium sp. V4]
MRLYRTPAGEWAGTQEDARALAKATSTTWLLVEVPVCKPGLLAFLNEHRVGAAPVSARSCEPSRLAAIGVERDMSASATLARMDNPGIDVDGICEAIGRARGYALKRYAAAVAIAFQVLAA